MASHQPAKFGGYRHCGSEDMMSLGCYVISQDHLIEGLCYFISSTVLPSLVAIGTVVVKI